MWPPHPDYTGFWTTLAIWIHVYTCLSGCKYVCISYYSVSFMGSLINNGIGQQAWKGVQHFWTPLRGSTIFDLTCGEVSTVFTHHHGISFANWKVNWEVNTLWMNPFGVIKQEFGFILVGEGPNIVLHLIELRAYFTRIYH